MYKEMEKASVVKKTTIKDNILALKEQMNDKRVSFVLHTDHKINDTPYWLLGCGPRSLKEKLGLILTNKLLD